MMLNRINSGLQKILPLITPLSVLIGVLMGSRLAVYNDLTPWIFAFLTFAGSIGMNIKQFMGVITHPIPLIASLFVLHLIMPLLAFGVGNILFSGDLFTITGLLLAAAIPTGITSVIWVAVNKGNLALTLSIILIDTLLSPFVVPYTLKLFIGAQVQMDVVGMMHGLLYMIVLPSVLGMLLNQWTRGRVAVTWGPIFNPFTKLGLGLVVAINSAMVAPYLRTFDLRILGMAAIVLSLAASGYFLSWLAAILLRADHADAVAITLNGGMRNISAGVVLASAYFPPPVSIPVVLGMLFQQILASLFSYLLKRHYEHQHAADNKGLPTIV